MSVVLVLVRGIWIEGGVGFFILNCPGGRGGRFELGETGGWMDGWSRGILLEEGKEGEKVFL